MLLDWGADSGNHWLLTAPPPGPPLQPSHISSINHSNFAFYSILLLSKHGVCIRSVPHSSTGLTLHCMDEQIEALWQEVTCSSLWVAELGFRCFIFILPLLMLYRESSCPSPARGSQTGLFTFQLKLVIGMRELRESISCSKGETVSGEVCLWAQRKEDLFVPENKISTLTIKLKVSEPELGWPIFLFPSRFAELININYKVE